MREFEQLLADFSWLLFESLGDLSEQVCLLHGNEDFLLGLLLHYLKHAIRYLFELRPTVFF